MAKFNRQPRDFYRSWDHRIVSPLLNHLPAGTLFIEPCAGAGDLTAQLVAAGHRCAAQLDLEPQASGIRKRDALSYQLDLRKHGALYITNPPWTLRLLNKLIVHLSDQGDTWLLFHEGWIHNKDTPTEARRRLAKQVSVGRVKWFEGSDNDYTKNVAWHLFQRDWDKPYAEQYGRHTSAVELPRC